MKSKSCLNQLKYFHVNNGLPPDLAHDLFEGFAIDIMNLLVTRYLRAKVFTFDDLNTVIQSFCYSEIDKKNKPQTIKVTSIANLKVKQTACEMWNLIRLFPLMAGTFMSETDPAWLIYLQFLHISERLCSSMFSHGDLVYLQSLIDEFFPEFLAVFGGEYDHKPKGHFLHYPKMIEIFGPLVKTFRSETKHSYFKSCLALNKNRKNIIQSMAKRHQMFMVLSYSKVKLLEHKTPKCITSQEKTLKEFNVVEQEVIRQHFVVEDSDLIIPCKAVEFEGQRYSTGEAVIIT